MISAVFNIFRSHGWKIVYSALLSIYLITESIFQDVIDAATDQMKRSEETRNIIFYLGIFTFQNFVQLILSTSVAVNNGLLRANLIIRKFIQN
ncbi:hypothetical protein T07_7922 [Trichinella nelsoni]|uniref:Uncharacterized protein n=1 Tax=Trichinella nelsoni TaxID=6336 RepID=A0A0V0RYA8_9BILA|nr:hypothetical protein T07_7922 [Trichinella nelsoni]